MQKRLQKLLSEAGIASRRNAEELILEGRVKVNNIVIKELGSKADPDKDVIKVNNKEIQIKSKKIYLALHKPVGIISSRKDEKDRKTVIDLIPIKSYIYPVGRLDYDSSGLILLTNDGEVANALIHPSYEIPKTYIVEIDGIIKKEEIERFEQGIQLEDGTTAPAKAKIISTDKAKNTAKMEIILSEGKNRQIRRMFEVLGYTVIRLKRVKIGKINLGNLENGEYRHLSDTEIKWLRQRIDKKKGQE
jgi:23S rRNA pseudouridine2605 synthase